MRKQSSAVRHATGSDTSAKETSVLPVSVSITVCAVKKYLSESARRHFAGLLSDLKIETVQIYTMSGMSATGRLILRRPMSDGES